ncbi:MAG: FmdB family zinc ribbon protein [Lentisphaeria bacterium]
MPTYEYKCEKCNARFEVVQRITDPPLEHCIKCNGKVRRLISGGAGFIFKGSGFYCTDYKKNSSPAQSSSPAQKPSASSTAAPANESKKSSKSEPCCHSK